MDASGPLPAVEIEPGRPARSAVVWLHGLGADGHDFEPIVPHLGLDPALAVRFVFPHAPARPVTINGGMVMPAWYDIRDIELGREVDERGVRESAEQVLALVRREIERGVPAGRIVLAGFSQGGAIALHVGLRHDECLAGVLAMSTYLVCADDLEREVTEAGRGVSVFQSHGTLDPMVPLAHGDASRRRLEELGLRVVWKTYPMGHEVSAQQIVDIGRWLGERLAG